MNEVHTVTTKDILSVHCQACYMVALNFLLQNPTNPDRGLLAFGQVLKYIIQEVDSNCD